MKKALCFIMSAILICCLIGCGQKEPEYIYTPEAQTKDEILKKAENGVMSPVMALNAQGDSVLTEVSLFMLRSDLVTKFTEDGLYTTKGEKYTCVSVGDINFYFLSSNIENGVVSMVNFDSIYDFDHGISTPEQIITRLGEPDSRANVSGDDIWFMPYSTGITCDRLSYTAGDNTLSFYFLDGFLSVTTLSVTKLW